MLSGRSIHPRYLSGELTPKIILVEPTNFPMLSGRSIHPDDYRESYPPNYFSRTNEFPDVIGTLYPSRYLLGELTPQIILAEPTNFPMLSGRSIHPDIYWES